ncbi:hypothetical protein ERJ75_001828400 [Trypanosoma vivax]|uniref:Transcription factor CBF/NF-Y/archaeal histone domain-containing protein n=1 Tax=Trypanosoma vivax (strain Y486) TaxID=1055687 RepID=G0U920_TRYVY|nr:hypothetical protein TRVL_06080 [Trypanosoma vivax]KAH8603451.1 hypothetical protein ERJ75_001828400 [Trypanosoma vivax]CCC54103.1 conserved hypothetical protein [Trypanosoma vivax Y486]
MDSLASEACPQQQSSAADTGRTRPLAAGQVNRAVSAVLPEGMYVSRDARIALQKAATVAVFYLACLAEDERSRESKRRVTLSSNDIKAALKAGGMGHLLPLLSGGQMKRVRSGNGLQQ